MNNLNIVWTAVGAMVMIAASFVASLLGSIAWVESLGLAGIALATLATRER